MLLGARARPLVFYTDAQFTYYAVMRIMQILINIIYARSSTCVTNSMHVYLSSNLRPYSYAIGNEQSKRYQHSMALNERVFQASSHLFRARSLPRKLTTRCCDLKLINFPLHVQMHAASDPMQRSPAVSQRVINAPSPHFEIELLYRLSFIARKLVKPKCD